VEKDQVIAEIVEESHTAGNSPITILHSPLTGILRGLLHSGLTITRGLKIGDIDPRDDPSLCRMVSDKALSVGGGVLEVILSRPEVRSQLWV